eukprot:NODE_343_length_924_cov_670.628607_g335_i0.p1 GENE.NODE_343_length_924_cov_670.628607_g335_i0~~NODE_343_length_924_cov_670.628607_g335_i0.p1  ORF type:complete len:165 (+),score=28.59 NODE_343_length_924_cov_670.628607_g335_i0:95-589(+)
MPNLSHFIVIALLVVFICCCNGQDEEELTGEAVHTTSHCTSDHGFKHEITPGKDGDMISTSKEWENMDPATFCCRQCVLTPYCTVWNLDPEEGCTFWEGDPWDFTRHEAPGWTTGHLVGVALDHNLHTHFHNERDDEPYHHVVDDPHAADMYDLEDDPLEDEDL